jgi:hypothetical protein
MAGEEVNSFQHCKEICRLQSSELKALLANMLEVLTFDVEPRSTLHSCFQAQIGIKVHIAPYDPSAQE